MALPRGAIKAEDIKGAVIRRRRADTREVIRHHRNGRSARHTVALPKMTSRKFHQQPR